MFVYQTNMGKASGQKVLDSWFPVYSSIRSRKKIVKKSALTTTIGVTNSSSVVVPKPVATVPVVTPTTTIGSGASGSNIVGSGIGGPGPGPGSSECPGQGLGSSSSSSSKPLQGPSQVLQSEVQRGQVQRGQVQDDRSTTQEPVKFTEPLTKKTQKHHAEDVLTSMLPRQTDYKTCTFVAVKKNPTEIARIFDILKDMCKTMYFCISRNCVTGESVDKTGMIIVCLWFERVGFDLFYHHDDQSSESQNLQLCLSVEDLSTSIRGMNTFVSPQKNSTVMTLFHNKTSPEFVGLFCAAQNHKLCSVKYVRNLQLPQQYITYDNIHLCCAVQMSSMAFKSALQCMRTSARVENVSIDFCFEGDVEHGKPNDQVKPVLVVKGGSVSAPCQTEIEDVCFVTPTRHESQEDATARVLVQNAVWRHGCLPQMSHLKKVTDKCYKLPTFYYNKDMLIKISQSNNLDQMVCIFVDVNGAIIMRYNVGTLGAVLFIVAPNDNDLIANSFTGTHHQIQEHLADNTTDSDTDADVVWE